MINFYRTALNMLSEYKVGDKVRIKDDCPLPSRTFPGRKVVLPPGYEFEIDAIESGCKRFVVCLYEVSPNNFVTLSVDTNNIELVVQQSTTKHKCHCPAENFTFNGIGCKCGGE